MQPFKKKVLQDLSKLNTQSYSDSLELRKKYLQGKQAAEEAAEKASGIQQIPFESNVGEAAVDDDAVPRPKEEPAKVDKTTRRRRTPKVVQT